MNNSLPWLTACLLLLSVPAWAGDAASDPRPNILVIVADDLGYGDLGFTGSADIRTPHIDRLARDGMVMTNGYVTHPYCGPSRAGMLTGRYQARFGMELNIDFSPFDTNLGLPVGELTIGDRLQKVGYRTGLIGKWHLGAAPPFHPNNRGFEYFYGFLGGGHDYFPASTSVARPLANPDGTPNGSALGGYNQPLLRNGGYADFDEYLTTAMSKDAAQFVAESKRPFFLFLSYNAPHTPLEAPAEFEEKYAHIEDPDRRTYAAMIDAMDVGIGTVISALEQSGKLDNTLIFFLSDNGGVYPEDWMTYATWSSNAPFRRGKVALTEGGIHVPFVVHWPKGLPAGGEFDGLVSALDIAATSVSLAGADDSDGLIDGRNLMPYLSGEFDGSPHEALFWRFAEGDNIWAVRTPTAKYLQQMLPGVGRSFFDMDSDPYEARNIVDQRTEQQSELARLWNAWNKQNIQNIWIRSEEYQERRRAFYDEVHKESLRRAEERQPYEIE
ncbi:MAG: sulfatase-like hydrolase/transferase [Woeseiaceae bacterium]